MDAFFGSPIGNIILGLTGNVLTEILFYITGKSYKAIKGKESLETYLNKNLTPKLQKSIAGILKYSESKNEIQHKEIQKFLLSPEITAIVRQIYAIKLISKNDDKLNLIYQEFINLFILNLYKEQNNNQIYKQKLVEINDTHAATLKNLGNEIFNAIVEGCEEAINYALDKGIVSVQKEKSSLRYQILLDEIATIQKNLNFLTEQQKPSIRDIQRSLHRSDCSGVLRFGSVQCSRCFANLYQWSMANRRK